MGLFDSVTVLCPECKHPKEAQSKSGPCELLTYNLVDAPTDIMANVNRHAPFECTKCKTLFEVDIPTRQTKLTFK